MAYRCMRTLGAVTAPTRSVAEEVVAAAAAAGHRLETLWGKSAGDPAVNEHATGRAIDFMVFANAVAGQWIADYIWQERVRLGLIHQIWRQRIRSTDPRFNPGIWITMADRGDPTANHYDHVHALFNDKYQPRKEGKMSCPITVIAVPGGQAMLSPRGVTSFSSPDSVRAAWAAGAPTVAMTVSQLHALARDFPLQTAGLGLSAVGSEGGEITFVDVGEEVHERVEVASS